MFFQQLFSMALDDVTRSEELKTCWELILLLNVFVCGLDGGQASVTQKQQNTDVLQPLSAASFVLHPLAGNFRGRLRYLCCFRSRTIMGYVASFWCGCGSARMKVCGPTCSCGVRCVFSCQKITEDILPVPQEKPRDVQEHVEQPGEVKAKGQQILSPGPVQRHRKHQTSRNFRLQQQILCVAFTDPLKANDVT